MWWSKRLAQDQTRSKRQVSGGLRHDRDPSDLCWHSWRTRLFHHWDLRKLDRNLQVGQIRYHKNYYRRSMWQVEIQGRSTEWLWTSRTHCDCYNSWWWGNLLDTNAVVDPLAVMIESLNTLVTYVAMSGFSCADHLTVWTNLVWIIFFQELSDLNLLRRFKMPWILETGDDE